MTDLDRLADLLEDQVEDSHGNYADHYNKHEDCPNFDRIEWLRDVAAKIRNGDLKID